MTRSGGNIQRRRAPRDTGGGGGRTGGWDMRGGPGRGRGYHVVAGDNRLHEEQLREGWWVLATADRRPVAFLTPTAAMAAANAPSVFDYLSRRRAGYIADLRNYDDVFERYLRASDSQRSVIVFDQAAISRLGLLLEDSFELTENYCERGYDPPPNRSCPGCTCRLAGLQR